MPIVPTCPAEDDTPTRIDLSRPTAVAPQRLVELAIALSTFLMTAIPALYFLLHR